MASAEEVLHTRYLATTRFGSLDGLRALSIVPVVWHHATPAPMDGVLGRGPLGVDLFFVISGFLITTLLLREREHTGGIALAAFYVRRSLRIFPLYYVVLGVFVIHALALRAHGPARDHFLHNVPFFATYTSNWLVDTSVPHPIVFAYAWSLATEEQFYLVWPWIVRSVPRLAVLSVLAGLVVVVDQLAERGALDEVVSSSLALRILRSLATPIALGALLAIGLRARATFAAIAWALGHRASSVVCLFLLVLAAVFAWPLLAAQLAMVSLVGASVLREDHLLGHVLRLRPVVHVGLVSYGMYLVNVPVIRATRSLLRRIDATRTLEESTALVFVVGLAGTALLASVAYLAIEKPLLGLRNRWRPR